MLVEPGHFVEISGFAGGNVWILELFRKLHLADMQPVIDLVTRFGNGCASAEPVNPGN
jgi:hypothetical protein